MPKSKLAIVIPAFKNRFFDKALSSISSQTDKNFTVYIGDDASPEDLKSTVNKYSGIIDICYVRFSNNLGAVDLVGQWNRCVGLIGDEEWIWLFSDDDIMEPDCVKNFYEHIAKFGCEISEKVLRFNTRYIDQNDCVVGASLKTPLFFDLKYFVTSHYIEKKLSCTIVEWVFPSRLLIKENGFVPFDLAWHSDDATCVLLGTYSGFSTIPGSHVSFRRSEVNISCNDSPAISKRKLAAETEFYKWIYPIWKDLLSRRDFEFRLKSYIGYVNTNPLTSCYIAVNRARQCFNLAVSVNIISIYFLMTMKKICHVIGRNK